MFDVPIHTRADLGARLIRADGSHRDCGVVAGGNVPLLLRRPVAWWRRLWAELRRSQIIPITLTFAAFLAAIQHGDSGPISALVTTVGANYMAADFLAASANRINAFNWHDCGTGTTAENVSQTALVTPYGGARQSGTQSNPAANQYRSVATLWFSSTLSIGEFGLFSAATAGTLWDRRLVAPTIGVNDGDSIQFTYTLTVNAG